VSVHFREFFIDFQRCIGCQACAAGCAECGTHRGSPMIHVDDVEPGRTPQTSPMVCMHCKVPTCALSCPADAIKVDGNGVVHSSLKPRCIACRNCELACPFGVPRIDERIQQMQKCDMCFDRTSAGKKPMCTTVCPTGALYYGSFEDMRALRPLAGAVNRWQFGNQLVETRVWVMVPANVQVLVVDWPELLKGAAGPVDLAMKLKERFQLTGIADPANSAPPLPEMAGAGAQADPEAEFL
jgi:Fe-S-cluster-containing dehydrogenase component